MRHVDAKIKILLVLFYCLYNFTMNCDRQNFPIVTLHESKVHYATHNSNLPQIRILSHTNSNLPQIRILSHTSSNSNLVTQNSNLFEVIHIRFIGIKFELNSNLPYSNIITIKNSRGPQN